jgi:hypothetical protein
MSWLLAPLTDRYKFRRMWAAADIILGYPRTHTEAEVIRYGAGPHAPISTIRTETHCEVWYNTQLAIPAVAMLIDPVLTALRDRECDVRDIDALIYRVRIRIDDLGWEVRANLPGNRADWNRVTTVRDGCAGSTTGVPL